MESSPSVCTVFLQSACHVDASYRHVVIGVLNLQEQELVEEKYAANEDFLCKRGYKLQRTKWGYLIDVVYTVIA